MWIFHSKMSQEEKSRAGSELRAALADHAGISEDEVSVDVSVQADWTGTLVASLDVRLDKGAKLNLEKVDEFFSTRLKLDVGSGAPNVRIGAIA